MRLQALDHVALFAEDTQRCASWYRDVLGLERRYADAWGDIPIVMAAADGTGVAIFPARASDAGPARRSPSAFAHVAFRVSSDALREAMAELRARGVEFEEQDHTIARSIYLHDPDGHQVELTTYEILPKAAPEMQRS